MALILPNGAFVHIHRTGGTWTRNVIKQMGIPTRETKAKKHATYRTVRYQLSGKFTWTFVRHPLRYLQSLWIANWYPRWPLKKNNMSFTQFIEYYLQHFPGRVGVRYRDFLEYNGKFPAVDFVGKTENLRDDLFYALQQCGELDRLPRRRHRSRKRIIYRLPPINRGKDKKRRRSCNYEPSLAKQVMDAEKLIMDTFNYDEMSP